jgi:hypothetical protein
MNEIDKQKLLLDRGQLEAKIMSEQGILDDLAEKRQFSNPDVWNKQFALSTKAIEAAKKRIAEIDIEVKA